MNHPAEPTESSQMIRKRMRRPDPMNPSSATRTGIITPWTPPVQLASGLPSAKIVPL
jgi:hypothetical protein